MPNNNHNVGDLVYSNMGLGIICSVDGFGLPYDGFGLPYCVLWLSDDTRDLFNAREIEFMKVELQNELKSSNR